MLLPHAAVKKDALAGCLSVLPPCVRACDQIVETRGDAGRGLFASFLRCKQEGKQRRDYNYEEGGEEQ